ncbi:N-acetylmuramoyl-L-alanine amidase_gp093 [Bacillus phage vB_BceM_WH1]|nr:N-acetylmuramoyl-L-alanine amidase_gp093 [Bacillus phage vB_BceM_WH1]
MARGDKQTNREDKYTAKLEAMKVNAEERLKWIEEYAKEIEANKKKKKGSGEGGETTTTEGGGGSFTGTMPTVADWKGPEKSAHGQTGMRGRVAGTDKWNDLIVQVCKEKGGVNPVFVKAIMIQESAGEPTTRSSAGYYGLMQVKASEYGFDTGKLQKDTKYQIECGVEELIGKRNTYWLPWQKNPAKFRFGPEDMKKVELYQLAWFYVGYSNSGYGSSYPKGIKEIMEGLGYKITDPFLYSLPEKAQGGGGGGGNYATNFPGGVQGATISNGKVNAPPAQSRSDYRAKILAARKGYTGHQRLDASRFVSNLSGCTMMEAPEFIPFVELLYNTMKSQNLLTNGKMLVNSAYRPGDNDFHGCGMAIDIGVEGRSRARAYQIADMAYNLGFRAVQPGGGFVHIDIGPPGSWGDYAGYPPYKGPGSGP